VTSVGPSSLTTLSVAGSVLDASEHDCAFTVGTPLVLPLEADDPSTLLFHFDVNGDGVDDLFYGNLEPSDATNTARTLVLLASRLDGDTLTFERTTCDDSTWDVSRNAYYLRDLNRDGVPDFVIGSMTGISAVLNLPGARPEFLHYDWPSDPKYGEPSGATITDVAVGDFDGDGRDDIAASYDRDLTNLALKDGTLVFRSHTATGTFGAPEILDEGTDDSALTEPAHMPAG
jgi:hypothetical protein